jgi:hypothetical protein
LTSTQCAEKPKYDNNIPACSTLLESNGELQYLYELQYGAEYVRRIWDYIEEACSFEYALEIYSKRTDNTNKVMIGNKQNNDDDCGNGNGSGDKFGGSNEDNVDNSVNGGDSGCNNNNGKYLNNINKINNKLNNNYSISYITK